MSRKRIAIALIALIVCATVLPAAFASADQRISGRNFTLIERVGDQKFLGSESNPSLGDRAVFSNALYDEQNQDRVGTSYGECTVVKVNSGGAPDLQCVVTAKLPGGSLTAQGVTSFSMDTNNDFAITGGTGNYVNARGQATVYDIDDNTSRIVFDL